MKQKILSVLRNDLIISDEAMKRYCEIASVRRGLPLDKRLLDVLKNKDNQLSNLESQDPDVISELKLLDGENVQCFLHKQDIPQIYKNYLALFLAESRHPHLNSPTAKLKEAEFKMFEDCLSRHFDIGNEHLEGLSGDLLRIILQEWFLYPQLICDTSSADKLLKILFCSNLIL